VPRYNLEGDICPSLAFEAMGERLAATREATKWAVLRRRERLKKARLERKGIQDCGASA
jgi:hypothetical protein